MILVAILGVVFILLVVGLMWHALRSSSGTVELASPEVLAQGESIYRENCVACHGDNGEGNVGPALNGSAHAWHHADAQLLSVMNDGIPGTQKLVEPTTTTNAASWTTLKTVTSDQPDFAG